MVANLLKGSRVELVIKIGCFVKEKKYRLSMKSR